MQHFGFLGGWLSLEGKKRNTQAGRYELGSVSILLFFFFLRYGGLEFAVLVPLCLLTAGILGMRHHTKKERRASVLGTAEAELIVLVQLINFL